MERNSFKKMRGISDRVLGFNLMNHKMNIEALSRFVAGQVWQNRLNWLLHGTVVVWLVVLTLYILRLQ